MTADAFLQRIESCPASLISRRNHRWPGEGYYMIHLASFGYWDGNTDVQKQNQRWLRKHYGDFVTVLHEEYLTQLAVIRDSTVRDLDWSSGTVQRRAEELMDVLAALTENPRVQLPKGKQS